MATTFRRPIPLWLRVSLSLLVLILAAPSGADAGCGDYVTLMGASGHAGRAASSTEPASPAKSPPAHPAPCTGPTCSRQAPLSLPLTSSSPRTLTGEHWGWVADQGTETGPTLRSFVIEESCGRPLHPGPSIFHPPR